MWYFIDPTGKLFPFAISTAASHQQSSALLHSKSGILCSNNDLNCYTADILKTINILFMY